MNGERLTTGTCRSAEAAQDLYRARVRPLLPPGLAAQMDDRLQATVTAAARADRSVAQVVRMIRRGTGLDDAA